MLPMPMRRRGGMTHEDPFDAMRREMDRVFSRFGGDLTSAEGGMTGAYPVDIREDDNHIYVDAELPGFKKEEINVTLEEGVLNITAERKAEEEKGEKHLHERRFTRVQRSFTLPTGVDESKVEAKLDEGVLHLSLPKREEVKPRKVEIM